MGNYIHKEEVGETGTWLKYPLKNAVVSDVNDSLCKMVLMASLSYKHRLEMEWVPVEGCVKKNNLNRNRIEYLINLASVLMNLYQ